VTNNIAKSFNN
jgi:hypothetical protein